MSIVPVHEAQPKLQELIEVVSQSHQPIVIAGETHSAVLLSQEDWAAIQETLYLVSIPGMRDAIREGLATPVDDCATELEW